MAEPRCPDCGRNNYDWVDNCGRCGATLAPSRPPDDNRVKEALAESPDDREPKEIIGPQQDQSSGECVNVPAGPRADNRRNRAAKYTRLAVAAITLFAAAVTGTYYAVRLWIETKPTASRIVLRYRLLSEAPIEVERWDGSATPAIRLQGAKGTIKFFQSKSGPPRMGGFSLLNSGGQVQTTVEFESYPKLVILPVECLLKNDGEKPVSIEEFQVAYLWIYSNTAWVAILNLLPIVGVYESDSPPIDSAKLPKLIAPAEEVDLVLRFLWPLEKQADQQFAEACPGTVETGHSVREVLHCLGEHHLKLSDNLGWRGARGADIIAVQAGGTQIHGSSAKLLSLEDDYLFR